MKRKPIINVLQILQSEVDSNVERLLTGILEECLEAIDREIADLSATAPELYTAVVNGHEQMKERAKEIIEESISTRTAMELEMAA